MAKLSSRVITAHALRMTPADRRKLMALRHRLPVDSMASLVRLALRVGIHELETQPGRALRDLMEDA